MDADGYAHYSALQNLADRAKVKLTEAQTAVDVLCAPDPNSANPENEGRRIERVPGGYLILNAGQYRKIANQEDQKEQNRERVRRHRAKGKGLTETTITDHYSALHPASASAYGSESFGRESEGNLLDTKGLKHGIPESVAVVIAYGSTLNPKVSEKQCRDFFAYYEGQARHDPNGLKFWITGGQNETVITNWKAKLPGWAEEKHNGKIISSNHPACAPRNRGTLNAKAAGTYNLADIQARRKLQANKPAS